MAKNDFIINGEKPASPVIAEVEDPQSDIKHRLLYLGMSKREHFAAMVATGKTGNPKEIAEHAVCVADALLKALENSDV